MPLGSHLTKNQLAFVLHEPPLPNRVRSTPTTQGNNVIGALMPGVVMRITDGSIEADGLLWWKIQSDVAQLSGWTPERDAANFFLGPVEGSRTCTDAVPAQLHLGDQAILAVAGPIHVRQEPSFEAAITTEFGAGVEMKIVGGPHCANRIVWWQITAAQLAQPQWIAEGQNGQYFLSPTIINKHGGPGGHYYIVQAGDGWLSVAQKFHTTPDALQVFNVGLRRPGLRLNPGERMWIAGQ